MAKKISDLPHLGYGDYSKDDLVEILDKDEKKSCSTSIGDVANYSKTVNNGGFKGVATIGIDDFTWEHSGVWRFDQAISELEIGANTGAIVEIITYARVDNTDQEEPDCLLQRLSYPSGVYQRFKIHNSWLGWNCLSNRNKNLIDYGSANISATDEPTEGYQKFNASAFSGKKATSSGKPVVTLSVIAPPTSTCVYSAVVTNVTSEGFNYIVYASNRVSSFEKTFESVNTKPDSSVPEAASLKTQETYIKSLYGAWTGPTENVTINYIATMEWDA